MGIQFGVLGNGTESGSIFLTGIPIYDLHQII